MSVYVNVQEAVTGAAIPDHQRIVDWIKLALRDRYLEVEITVRVVDEAEMISLNTQYRQKSGLTNVLSFPFDPPEEDPSMQHYLGDIVICASVVLEEALRQEKEVEAHWAHLVIHGVLHLIGFDHNEAVEAEAMESLETTLITSLGYADPYRVDKENA